MKKHIAAIAVLGTVAAVSTAANAAVTGFVNAPTGSTRFDTLPQAGFAFFGASVAGKQVNQLGYWVSPADSGGTGVTAVAHTIALYHYIGAVGANADNYRQEVAQVTLPANSTPDASGYAWVTIPTYTIADASGPGDYYFVTASVGTDLWTNGGLTVNPSGGAAFGTLTGHGYFSENNSFPGQGNSLAQNFTTGPGTISLATGTDFGGPNIGFDASVPEPTSLGLLGLGALGLIRRRRQA